jgi:tRNA U34 5-methylaminomethyl-2-thiouridine-forming methyltransferase MnmC
MTSELRTTADGTHTLFSARFNQTYHSSHGALAEADHVYVFLSRVRPVLREFGHVSVLEIGFGTGLNLVATLRACADLEGTLTYVSMEPFPVTAQVIQEIGYGRLLSEAAAREYELLMTSVAGAANAELVQSRFTLERLQVNVAVWRGPCNTLPNALRGFDVVYQDAFSPDACPELWTLEHFEEVRSRLRDGAGRLATFSCAAAVRKALVAAGWEVQPVPGPVGGKREVLQAVYNPGGRALPGDAG